MKTAICRVAGVPPARGAATLASPFRGQDVRDTFSYTFLVADLIKLPTSSENTLRCLGRMTSGASTVGGAGLRPAGSAGSLRDLLSFRLGSGDYPLSRDLTLGYLQDRELILRVE